MDVTIRPYEDADEAQVVGLWRAVFPDSPPWNVPENDIRMKKQVQPELFFVAQRAESAGEAGQGAETGAAGTVVGTAMAGYDGHRGTVFYVAVDPAHRRQGIGRALMRRVERALAGIGCIKLNLMVRSTNKQVIAFYERLGYEVEDRVNLTRRLDDGGGG